MPKGKFDNIIIVSDLDGTFFNSQSVPAPANLEALAYFKANGGRFTFATGRGETAVHKKPLGGVANIPVILANGAVIADYDRYVRLREVPMHPVCVGRLHKIQQAHPQTAVTLVCKDLVCGWNRNERMQQYITHNDIPLTQLPPGQPFTGAVDKTVICGDHEELLQIADELRRANVPDTAIMFSTDYFLELVNETSTKGKALRPLAELCGCPDATVFAIGDYQNDLEMLQTADFSATPVNGLDELKHQADYVVASNDEGAVADLIRIIEKKHCK
ncbi:MAG: HAD hydrolase family protein [Clostridia bacterium]|nr:HAD hydrolase family protein [Clostridia bacterium]